VDFRPTEPSQRLWFRTAVPIAPIDAATGRSADHRHRPARADRR
jgi:hypothetical protein